MKCRKTMTMLDILQMFNWSLSKIMQISFGRGEFCEKFSASIPFLFTARAQSGQDQK